MSSVPPPFEGFDSSAPPPLIGQTLGGKYRAIRVLGEGGMGAVYECDHVALHRKVAVKVLHPAQARKKASVARFQNEAHVAGAIGHPNICSVLDMGELDDGSPFLVMELLLGETLAERIASEGALPFDDVVDVISQVLSGLVAAHARGVIHRDIKPENVFLTTRAGLPAMVKLLDFGISKVAGADDLHLTRTGMVMGTPFYMSPEQARGDRNLDHRVDIYATGVMMYECLTGRRPFHAANYNALLMQILTADPRPLRDVRPAIPEPFEHVISKAMSRDRERRFQNASDFQREVSALRDPGAIRGRMPSVPPEPVPLVTQRRREPDPPSRPRELKPVSVDIENRDLLDSGLLRDVTGSHSTDDSGSVEIPIVAEAPISSRDPQPAPSSRGLYRPDPALIAQRERASQLPPQVELPPSQRARESSVQRPPPSAQSRPVHRDGRGAMPPAIPPRTEVQAPPQGKRREEYRAPTPTSLDALPSHFRNRDVAPPRPNDDEPEFDDENVDPTVIGSIFGNARARLDTPIDADSTERIPPERLQRLQNRLPRAAREVAPNTGRDPRADPPDNNDRLATDKFDALVPPAEDEAPTTLFDRRSLKGKNLSKKGTTGGNPQAVPRATTTERAPAPSPVGRQPSVAPPPIPRLGKPKDR